MTDLIPAMYFDWDGEVMRPRNPKMADRYYTVGEEYRLVPHEERSHRSHAHYFASINEAWKNLPEEMADRFASPEHLRKFVLIRCGYRNERTLIAASEEQAAELAAFIAPMDDYALVHVDGKLVTVYTAKSQSMRAMGKKDFAESKNKVLDYLAAMIKVSREELEKNAEMAA